MCRWAHEKPPDLPVHEDGPGCVEERIRRNEVALLCTTIS